MCMGALCLPRASRQAPGGGWKLDWLSVPRAEGTGGAGNPNPRPSAPPPRARPKTLGRALAPLWLRLSSL